MMKGEQQKIVHKGTKEKVNVFITLLYPLNKIKFNMTGKTRNSSDFINHLKNIKRYVGKEISNDSFSSLTTRRFMSAKNQPIISKDSLNGSPLYTYQKKHHF